MKIKYSLLLFLLINVLHALEDPFVRIAAYDTIVFNIHNSIYSALEGNPIITIVWLDHKKAKDFAKEQRALYDPILSASVNKSESKSQRFLGSRPQPFELTTVRTQYQAQLSQRLPTGTTVDIASSFSSTESSIYIDQYVGTMSVTFSQSLLKGAGLGANLASLRRARFDIEISKEEMRAMAEQMVANVETAYWNLYLADREIDIQRESLALAQKQLQESLERVAVGKLPDFELAAVHAEVSSREEALITAQSRYHQARLQFLYLLNPKHENSWNIMPLLLDHPVIPPDSLGDVELHEALGLKYRPDLRQAELNLKKGKLEIARTRNGLLPRLDFFITLGRTSYAQTFKEGLPDYNSPFYDITGGINFELPVLNRKESAQAGQARWSFEQMQLSYQNMQRMVQWDVRTAYIEVMRTRKLIETTQATLALQEKKLAAELEKFRVGRSTNYLVLQAQRDFTASQLQAARTIVSYLEALIKLYQSEGTLLQRRGIADLAE